MESEWARQAFIGLIGGGGVFVAVFLPLLVLQLRRYGRISVARLVGAAAVSVYAVAVLAYTFIPLPDSRTACASGGIPAQLWPFAFVGDIATDVHDHGTSALLTGRATLQVAFNVLLFVPLGVAARRFWSFGVLASTTLGLVVSLLIEVTQYTGIWGVYECAYRVADVDDLIANTSGALVGALLAPLLLWWMPRGRDLRSRRLDPRPVTVWRRWLGMIIDLAAFGTVSVVMSIGISGIRLLAGRPIGSSPFENVLIAAVSGIVVFLLPALRDSGASLGQRLVWLEPTMSGGGRPPLARRLARAATTGGAYTASVVLGAIIADDATGSPVLGSAQALTTLLVVIAVIAVPFTRGRRGLSGVLSGTEMGDVRKTVPSASTVPSEPSIP